MPNEENDNSPGMLFDSVFKTATQKAGHLMVAGSGNEHPGFLCRRNLQQWSFLPYPILFNTI